PGRSVEGEAIFERMLVADASHDPPAGLEGCLLVRPAAARRHEGFEAAMKRAQESETRGAEHRVGLTELGERRLTIFGYQVRPHGAGLPDLEETIEHQARVSPGVVRKHVFPADETVDGGRLVDGR